MKKIKKHLFIILSCLLLATSTVTFISDASVVVQAHSGRTDSSGGHHDNKNKSGLGSYHYHHGYPAHLHKNGVCPYEGNNSTISPKSNSTSNPVNIPSSNTQVNITPAGSPETPAGSSVVSSDTDSQSLMETYQLVFDPDYYYNANPDLQVALGSDASVLFQHFYNSGMSEGRKGCEDFDVNTYKANNPDLQAVYGDDLKSYYVHYILAGYAEGRVH